ncbi:MAG TPA: hypothetical protein VGL86_03760 [Polyangia bacterium]
MPVFIERWYHALNDDRMVQVKAAIAVVGAILLVSYWLADEVPIFRRWRRLRDGLLIAIGLVSCASWWNLGRFHFDPFIHYYEFYHYYLGAKYAPELGYTRLYECTVAAEAEFAPPLRPMLARAPIRDLTTNVLGSSEDALAHPEKCKEHFTEERWQAFMRDSHFFERASSWQFWSSGLKDNGYNGTPVWRVLGGLIANRVDRMNDDALHWLAYIDPLLLFAMFGLVWWAFGWRTLCVTLLFFGTNYAGRYWWTGGAFLRMDWLFATVASICFMKKKMPFASGFAIAYATLLRIFPGFVAAALVLKMAIACVRARKLALTTAHKRWIAGAAVAFVVMLPISTVYGGGVECWRGFVANSAKHLQTPLTNNMGWRTVVAYSRSTDAKAQRNYKAIDPFAQWKQDQLDNFHSRKLVYVVGLLGFLLLLGMAVERHDDWIALTLGTGLIIFAAQLTCYYFIGFLAFAFLWPYIPWSGAALALVSYWSCQIPLALLGWDDERYVAISGVYILFVLAVTATLAFVSGEPPAPSPKTIEKGARSKKRRGRSKAATR